MILLLLLLTLTQYGTAHLHQNCSKPASNLHPIGNKIDNEKTHVQLWINNITETQIKDEKSSRNSNSLQRFPNIQNLPSIPTNTNPGQMLNNYVSNIDSSTHFIPRSHTNKAKFQRSQTLPTRSSNILEQTAKQHTFISSIFSKKTSNPPENLPNIHDIISQRKSTLPLHNPNSMSMRSSKNQHADIPINTVNTPKPAKNSSTSPPNYANPVQTNNSVPKIPLPKEPKPNMYLHSTDLTDLHLTNKLIKHIRGFRHNDMNKLVSKMTLEQINHGHIMGETALHEACIGDNTTAVRALLAVPGILLNTR